MKIGLRYLTQLQTFFRPLADELEGLVAGIQGGWNVEHKDTGRHKDIHAETLEMTLQQRVRVYRVTSSQSLTSGVATAIQLNAVSYDIGAFFSLANNTRLTVPAGAAGFYLAMGSVQYATSAAGLRAVSLRKNGLVTVQQVQGEIGGAANPSILQVATLVSLAAGEYLELIGYQSSGGALNAEASESATNIQLVKLW